MSNLNDEFQKNEKSYFVRRYTQLESEIMLQQTTFTHRSMINFDIQKKSTHLFFEKHTIRNSLCG